MTSAVVAEVAGTAAAAVGADALGVAVCATADGAVSALAMAIVAIASGTSALRFVFKLFSFQEMELNIVCGFVVRFKAISPSLATCLSKHF